MTMKLIMGFEEEFATTDKPPAPPLKDFSQIPEALKHDANVAENIFARGAKKELRQALSELFKEEIPHVRAADCSGTYPIWIVEITVVLPVSDSNFARYLSSSVRTIADAIMDQLADESPAMVDPLQVRMIPVQEDVYQFRMKQKWSTSKALNKEKSNVAS